MTQISKREPKTPREAAGCCRPVDERLDPEFFKALADPTRVTLLACLAKCGRACSVSEIAECCAVDLSVVSRHLTQLERASVLKSIRHGRVVTYEVEFGLVSARLRALAEAFDECAAVSIRQPEGDPCCG